MSAIARTYDRPLGTELPRGIGLHGRVAVTWAAAGGILLGGVLVAVMTLAGRLSGHGLFFTVSGLFVIGAVLGSGAAVWIALDSPVAAEAAAASAAASPAAEEITAEEAYMKSNNKQAFRQHLDEEPQEEFV